MEPAHFTFPDLRSRRMDRDSDGRLRNTLRKGRTMLLSEFVGRYCQSHDLAEHSAEHLRYSVRMLERHVNRSLDTNELSAEIVQEWIEARLKAGISRIHVSRQRGAVLSIWREAFRQSMARDVPSHIRIVKLKLQPPRAWHPQELDRLLVAIETCKGAFACGVPRKLFLRAMTLTGYYTGLRPGDLRAIKTDQLTPDGTMVIVQSKTGVPIDCVLPPDALAAIQDTLPHTRDILFPVSRKNLCFWWREVTKVAGIRGTPKWLRRTGATRCEQQQAGSAMAYLGHKTPGLAYKHYVDPAQIASTRPVPPALPVSNP